jgi:squalene-hopene/tetraprenyl-beta-curcumene cyclase
LWYPGASILGNTGARIASLTTDFLGRSALERKKYEMNAQSRRSFLVRSIQGAGLISLGTRSASAFAAAEDAHAAAALAARAVAFLRPRQDRAGSWSGDREPGITALVVTAMLRSGRIAPEDPVITKGLTYLQKYIGPNGGLSEAPHSVYTTSVALMAFHEANRGGRYDRIIKGSQEYLKTTQTDEGEGKSGSDPAYGGLGYGGTNSRPDMSNTAFFIEALRESGLPPDDLALRKALIFVSRCQNLKSEFNDQPFAGKINDGGFVYNPGAGSEGRRGGPGASAKGNDNDIPLRSYAGMTYAGLKSMIYAGLTENDPRVKAAIEYIKNHYTLDENPGQGERGLYYYYQTFAKAMALLGKPTVVDAQGKEHNWRAELVAALAKRQAANGSWVNPDDRFMEGDPHIVTSFALLALASARAKP